jgi:hypothetical protein
MPYDYGNAGRTFLQGVTYGFGDEAEAKLRTLFASDPRAYEREVARIRAAQERYAEANPKMAMGLEGVGMIGGAMLTPELAALRVPGALSRIAARAPTISKIAVNGLEDALQGAAYTAGKSERPRTMPRHSADTYTVLSDVARDIPGNALTYMEMTGLGALGKQGLKRVVATQPGYRAAMAARNFFSNPLAVFRR